MPPNSTGTENQSDGSQRSPVYDWSESIERRCSVPLDSETEKGW